MKAKKSNVKSVEQLCKDILERVIREGIVEFNAGNFCFTQNAQELSSGDLIGLANFVARELKERK